MSDNRTDETIFTRAKPSLLWWRLRIYQFEGIKRISCQVLGHDLDGKPITWRAKPPYATCWVVYGISRFKGVPSGYEVFASCTTEYEAWEFSQRLLHRFPHLADATRRARPYVDDKFSK